MVSSILTIALCLGMISGATFALFTDEASTNIVVTAGTVQISAEVDEASITLTSMGREMDTAFENGGEVSYDADTAELTLTYVTPGDKVAFNIDVTNTGNVDIQYRIVWHVDGALSEALVATVDGEPLVAGASDWNKWNVPATGLESKTLGVTVELPLDKGNEYQGDMATITFTVEAVQANGTDLYETAFVSTVEDLEKALEAGGEVRLTSDIVITPDTELRRGNYIAAIFEDTTLDLNGHNITFDLGADKASSSPRMFYVYTGTLNIVGEGTLSVTNDAAVAWATRNGALNIYGGDFVSDNYLTGNPNDIFAIIYSSGGEVHVYGGTFTYGNMSGGTNGGFNVQDWWGHKITLHEGVLLSNEVYRQPQDTEALRIRPDEGCELQEVLIDGVTWYKVTKSK